MIIDSSKNGGWTFKKFSRLKVKYQSVFIDNRSLISAVQKANKSINMLI